MKPKQQRTPRFAMMIGSVGLLAILLGIWCAVASATIADRDWFVTHISPIVAEQNIAGVPQLAANLAELTGIPATRAQKALEADAAGDAILYQDLVGHVHDSLFVSISFPANGITTTALADALEQHDPELGATLRTIPTEPITVAAPQLPNISGIYNIIKIATPYMIVGGTLLIGVVVALTNSKRNLLHALGRRALVQTILLGALLWAAGHFASSAYATIAQSTFAIWWPFGLILGASGALVAILTRAIPQTAD